MASGSNPLRTRQRAQDDNDRVDPSTSQTGTPSKTRLANIPTQAIEEATDSLRRIIHPKDDDERIRNSLKHVWTNVHDALEQDPELGMHLASRDVFRTNVTRKGEKNFIDSLRVMATNSDSQGSKAWESLFSDGTSFSLGPSILIVFSI